MEHSMNGTVTLAPFQQNRTPRQVMVYTSPVEYENVVSISLCFRDGGKFNLPVIGAWRICTGPETPKWSADQETQRGVRSIQLVFSNGRVENIDTNPSFPITIALGEA